MRLLLFILATSLAIPAIASEFSVSPVWIAGGSGSSLGKFGTPESVALDSLGRVVVTDKGNMRLHVYSSTDGTALFDVGQLGSDPEEFNRPNGIAVDSKGRILVVEQRNYRVQILDPDYRYESHFGTPGTGPGQFIKGMGIALDSQDRMYVTDEGRADVQVFDSNGDFLWSFGRQDPRLRRVESIEVHEPSGRIFVCDESRSEVQVYDLAGNYLHSFGGRGTGPGQFGNDPNAVRLDVRGRIYINDQGNQRINVYAPDTSFLASFRNTAGGMESADGVALSERHNLFLVADQGHDRVLAFDLGEIECRLAWLELDEPAAGFGVLHLSTHPFWSGPPAPPPPPPGADVRLFLQAHALGGSPLLQEAGIVHVRSLRDPRGICLVVPEIEPPLQRFSAVVQLAETSDETKGQLATFLDDTLQVHVPGNPETLVIGLVPLDPPRLEDVQLDHRVVDRPFTRSHPLIHWTLVDPAGLRPQTAYEIRIVRPGFVSRVLWQSGVRSTSVESCRYDGDPLPVSETLHLELRAGMGRAWTPWSTFAIRRNAAPVPRPAGPPDGAVVSRWPVHLRAVLPTDRDSEPQRCRFEARLPDGRLFHSPVPSARDDTLQWWPAPVPLEENTRLQWRLVASDRHQVVTTAWQSLDRNEVEEPPSAPQISSPTDAARIHAASVTLRWKGASDPDPQQAVSYDVEWSPTATFDTIERVPTGSATSWVWSGAPDDGVYFWRVRATDSTGRSTTSEVQRLVFERNWMLVLRALSDTERSLPLRLGARVGAQDGFVRGEDGASPSVLVGLQLASEHPGSKHPRLHTDLRSPRDLSHTTMTWDLVLQAPMWTRVWLETETMPLSSDWEIAILDRTGDLQAPFVFFETTEKRFRIRVGRPRRPGPDQHAPREETETTPDPGLARLPNPLRLGTRLRLAPLGARSTRAFFYDVRGRLRIQTQAAPGAEWTWTGHDDSGRRLAPGVYLLRLRVDGHVQTRKLLWTGH